MSLHIKCQMRLILSYIKNFEHYHHLKSTNKDLNLITVERYSPKKKGYDILVNVAKELIKKNIDFEWKPVGKETDNLLNFEISITNPKNFNIV